MIVEDIQLHYNDNAAFSATLPQSVELPYELEPGHSIEVEVTHEALLREWPRLRGWLDDARADLRLHSALTAAVAEWIDLGGINTSESGTRRDIGQSASRGMTEGQQIRVRVECPDC